jgi:hypothetical protein
MRLGDLAPDCRTRLIHVSENPYLVEQTTALVESFAEVHDVGVPWHRVAAHAHDSGSAPQGFATQLAVPVRVVVV